jgi:hypothetical protein
LTTAVCKSAHFRLAIENSSLQIEQVGPRYGRPARRRPDDRLTRYNPDKIVDRLPVKRRFSATPPNGWVLERSARVGGPHEIVPKVFQTLRAGDQVESAFSETFDEYERAFSTRLLDLSRMI